MFWRLIEGVVVSSLASATPVKADFPEKFLKHSKEISHLPVSERLDYFAAYFVTQKTPFGWLPEMPSEVAEDVSQLVDQLTTLENRESFLGLDCVTFVETVLALTQGIETFSKNLKEIRYTGAPSFLTRNHFLLDTWIAKNARFLRDVTGEFSLPLQETRCELNYLSWLYHHDRVKGFRDAHPEFTLADLEKTLHARGVTTWGVRENVTPYLKTQDILDHWEDFQKNIPDQSIVVIVRPNWQVKDKVGTNMNESHLGFALKHGNILHFVHATSVKGMVVQDELKTYLEGTLKSPTIGGIRVFEILFLVKD